MVKRGPKQLHPAAKKPKPEPKPSPSPPPPVVWPTRNVVYTGALNELGQFHGFGHLVDTMNDRAYIGHFKNGLRHGEGTLVDGMEVYSGFWKDGEMAGQCAKIQGKNRDIVTFGDWREKGCSKEDCAEQGCAEQGCAEQGCFFQENTCSFCLQPIEYVLTTTKKQEVVVSPVVDTFRCLECGNRFHTDCYKRWKKDCPICRVPVFRPDKHKVVVRQALSTVLRSNN